MTGQISWIISQTGSGLEMHIDHISWKEGLEGEVLSQPPSWITQTGSPKLQEDVSVLLNIVPGV